VVFCIFVHQHVNANHHEQRCIHFAPSFESDTLLSLFLFCVCKSTSLLLTSLDLLYIVSTCLFFSSLHSHFLFCVYRSTSFLSMSLCLLSMHVFFFMFAFSLSLLCLQICISPLCNDAINPTCEHELVSL
jgi:hypothetical protein